MDEETDDITKKLEKCSLENPLKITAILEEISAAKPDTYDYEILIKQFIMLLKLNNNLIQIQVAKCIADILRQDIHRKNLTNINIFETLFEILKNVQYDNIDFELLTQICRAIGNICYNNDDARQIIIDLNGDEILIKLLDIIDVDFSNDVQNRFLKARSGLLPNLLLGNENISVRAIKFNILEKIDKIFDYCILNDVDVCSEYLLQTVSALSILTENVTDLNFEPKLNLKIMKILTTTKNPEVAEVCLELLHFEAENDDVKTLLAKEGFCQALYQLLVIYQQSLAGTNEARALMKLACDVIVLILTGDEAMNHLYSTPLLQYMEDWLESTDLDLVATGVLALGNFARSDSHCIYMVEKNVAKKLLDILSQHNGVEDDVRLQHALLSTLRNLVIPKPNKPRIIEAGLVQIILPMLEIHQPTVVYKLLGTLRMTVDGQDQLAKELLQNACLLKQLVTWSRDSEYASVTAESLRLMAWLIQHAFYKRKDSLNTVEVSTPSNDTLSAAVKQQSQPTNEECLKAFINVNGTVNSMVNMLTSHHMVMQNEALVALCVISTMLQNSTQLTDINLDNLLIECNLGGKLTELITKYADTMTKEIVENLQTFIALMRKSEKLVSHLQTYNIDDLLKSIPILTEYCTI